MNTERQVVEGAPHGTVRGYFLKCRCAECTQAHSTMCAESYRQRKASLEADPTSQPHGVINTYAGYGCRCQPCKDASREYNRHRKAVNRGENPGPLRKKVWVSSRPVAV